MANGRHDGQGETTIEGSIDTIFHVTAAIGWRAAEASGAYRLSTRDRSLEDEGFIHCSYANQLIRVADAFYRGVQGLVVLVIDPQRVTAPVRDESLAGGDERFPHIYGPLNLDAVIEVLQFEPANDGTFTLPEPLRT